MAIKRRRWWWLAGPALLVASLASGFLHADSSLTVGLIIAAVCWFAATAVWLAWRAWRWLTYRVAVRLFLSYLLLGVTPFIACGIFGLVALFLLMGQYLSVQFGHTIDHTADEMRTVARSFLRHATTEDPEKALGILQAQTSRRTGPFERLVWHARLSDGADHRSINAPTAALPPWVWEEERAEVVQHDESQYFLVSTKDPRSDNAVVFMGPLDAQAAAEFSRDQWYQVAFLGGITEDPDLNLQLSANEDGTQVLVRSGDTADKPSKLWGQWTEPVTGLLERAWIVWYKLPENGVLDLETGEPSDHPLLLMLLRSSPANVWKNFTASNYEIASEIRGALFAVAVFFMVVYAAALLISGSMILSITRATTRLTRGARAVGQGELGHRVPVRRHDQLGELANGFNRMASSVQDMLEEVKEKERLAQEMELARQIQESLLPDSQQKHGAFAVHATFHPAAEVGGDAFDVFVPNDGRLQVMIADVAGHGLSTGLLMASLKATIATLLDEGYTGRDLVRRVNRRLLDEQRNRTMATLAIIDANAGRNRLHLVNAGHPPPFLIGPEGGIRELLMGSLPLGTRLCQPSTLDCEFLPGARVVLYSDGLVEAENADRAIYGFDRLASLLDKHRGLETAELLGAVVSDWKAWIAGQPARDDMTVVILERSHDL